MHAQSASIHAFTEIFIDKNDRVHSINIPKSLIFPALIFKFFSKNLFTLTITKLYNNNCMPVNQVQFQVLVAIISWKQYYFTIDFHVFFTNKPVKITRQYGQSE